MEGHFAEGAAGTLTLSGGVEAPFVLDIVEPNRRFLDRITMGDLVINIDHEVTPNGDGSSITVTTHIVGPGATDIGPMVDGGHPEGAGRPRRDGGEGILRPVVSGRSRSW